MVESLVDVLVEVMLEEGQGIVGRNVGNENRGSCSGGVLVANEIGVAKDVIFLDRNLIRGNKRDANLLSIRSEVGAVVLYSCERGIVRCPKFYLCTSSVVGVAGIDVDNVIFGAEQLVNDAGVVGVALFRCWI
jgi:hypothetical protein